MTIEAQLKLEEEASLAGIDRAIKHIEAAKKAGDWTRLKPVENMVDMCAAAMAPVLKTYIRNSMRGKAGRKSTFAPYLKKLDVDTLVYMTCRLMVNSVITGINFAPSAVHLGKAVNDEVELRRFKKANPGAYGWTEKQLKSRKVTSEKHRRGFFRKVAKLKGEVYETWPTNIRLSVGSVLIQMFCDSTRLVKVATVKGQGKHRLQVLQATEQFTTWILNDVKEYALKSQINWPMIVEPQQWDGFTGGGYLTVDRSFVSNTSRRYGSRNLDSVECLKDADMDEITEAVGHLDRTGFKVNERILEVLQHHFDKRRGVPGVIDYTPLEIPPKPDDIDTNKAARKAWSKQKRMAIDKHESSKGVWFQIKRSLDEAQKFKGKTIYFPHFVDFRGRIYDMPSEMHPQGPDYSRALIQFSKGKPVKDDEAMFWLIVHGANCWGFDKCSMEDRVRWVKDHADQIAKTYHDPIGYTWWHEADKPFQFLAWVFDYIGVIEHRRHSYIRVAMDGSCNGLQHFSAMLRDPIGGKAVNLIPGPTPSDIYQDVAEVVKNKLRAVQGKDKWMADIWLPMVDRKLCKRSVMVMPYGGTRHSTMNYIEEEFKKRVGDGPNPFGEDSGHAVGMLSTMVYNATREVVAGGKQAMDWLQSVAKLAADYDVHLKWKLPHGFVVQQYYRKTKLKRIDLLLNGTRIQPAYVEDVDQIDPKRSVNGISPNFVHSYDACALVKTVNEAVKHGITHFQMVHDDYGTHAADTPTLARILREQFVELYRGNVLADFKQQVLDQLPSEAHPLVPEIPKQGTLDIEEVLNSEFFFA